MFLFIYLLFLALGEAFLLKFFFFASKQPVINMLFIQLSIKSNLCVVLQKIRDPLGILHFGAPETLSPYC